MSLAPARTQLRLSVPARSEQISTVRSFAYAVGRQHGLDDEAIEDLKLALSELAAEGIEGGGSAIAVTVAQGASGIEVSVEVPGGGSRPTAPEMDRAQIVGALFPSVRSERRSEAVVTTFSVRQG